MNVITMKLENRQISVESCKPRAREDSLEKKCKKVKKSTADKDALVAGYGLGRRPSEGFELSDSKSNPDPDPDSKKSQKPKKSTPIVPETMQAKSDQMQDRLQHFLSSQAKEKISALLNDVKSLSDVEKLYLYLQLPTGSTFEAESFKPKIQNPLGKKADEEGLIAMTWIQSHLEEDQDISLPKQEVYDEYQSFCQMSGLEPLCAADFGKVMKQIFPSVKPRRLGTRGNSRYCYSGLRKKVELQSPSLPDIMADNEQSSHLEESIKDESTSAACHILFEWAEKLLGVPFTSLKSLASHLLEHMYVDNRSVAAFTVMLDGDPQMLEKEFGSSDKCSKKTEAQVHLQRKIQEKELIKEQRKKLQEQRLSLAGIKVKSVAKRKTSKPKKKKTVLEEEIESSILIMKSEESNSDETKASSNLELQIKEETTEIEELVLPDNPSISLDQSSPLSVIPAAPSVVPEIEDSAKKKIIVSRSKTPVCIAQNLPGIILVNSLPAVTEVGKSNIAPVKYKRIQPKPIDGSESMPTFSRSRSGSVGSTVAIRPKKKNDGRRSSHAWLKFSLDGNSEESPPKSSMKIAPSTKNSTKKNNSVVPLEPIPAAPSTEIDPPSQNVDKITFVTYDPIANKAITELIRNTQAGQVTSHDTLKRHLNEESHHSTTKRPHLDTGQASKTSTIQNLFQATELPNFGVSMLQDSKSGEEEVSVNEIEGDAALDDYFRVSQNLNRMASFKSLQLKSREEELDRRQQSCNNKVKKLSQLRMLLEQNLPRGIFNAPSKDISTVGANQTKPFNFSDNKQFLSDLLGAAKQIDFCSEEPAPEVAVDNTSSVPELHNFEKLLSFSNLNTQLNDNELLSNANLFLHSDKADLQQMDISLQNSLASLSDNAVPNDVLLSSALPEADYLTHQNNPLHSIRVNTYTQVPSVPQSPNTRRRAFNFMPISPRHTPIPEMSSPIPSHYPRGMTSVAVGPSQPPSNAGSPFVSPRSTPVSFCSRSRHSSGQSTSRHTPFQSADSGVSSVCTSPFVSPQPTPAPLSRLRHNSAKTVTFCSAGSPQVMQSSAVLRSRHSSGPGGPFLGGGGSLYTPLSPLVNGDPAFVFPTGEAVRSRNSSGTSGTSLSPEQTNSSSSSCTGNLPDLHSVSGGDFVAAAAMSRSFLNDRAADLLINGNLSNFKQVRQRHASSSVIYNKQPLQITENFSPEMQTLLRSNPSNPLISLPGNFPGNRSQSVPLHQMLDSYGLLDDKTFSFTEQPSSILGQDKMEWATGDLDMTSARLEPPLSDDLQTTLEDLRDCDTDFSKFAQELELGQNEDVSL